MRKDDKQDESESTRFASLRSVGLADPTTMARSRSVVGNEAQQKEDATSLTRTNREVQTMFFGIGRGMP